MQVSRPVSTPNVNLDLKPGRRRAYQIYTHAVQKLSEETRPENVEVDLGLVYSLGSFRSVLLGRADDEMAIMELVSLLEERHRKKEMLRKDLAARRE